MLSVLASPAWSRTEITTTITTAVAAAVVVVLVVTTATTPTGCILCLG